MELPKLNFTESFDFQLRKDKDKYFIYDITRKNWLLLTPEEWVRQHWIHHFTQTKGFATSALISEKKIELNGLTKRIDLLVTKKTKPYLLIECKAPKVPLTEKTFEQTARYNSIIQAQEILLTNGLQHIWAEFKDGKYHFKR
ncbi:MAG: hypothetical protein CSA38_02235 [Flavobacteriales bacterium]|nr:MAG: hypothetical protein CSA38_02235 [Flavobacteriales bacterium]